MATIGDVTVKVNYEMTEVSKQLIRGMVAQVLKEALLDDSARVPFDSKDAVREFIRAEVRLALSEGSGSLYQEIAKRLAQDIRLRSGLPSWARMEAKGTPVQDW